MKMIPGTGVTMVRGRRHAPSDRQDRFLGSYGCGQDQVTTDADLSELGEEDVWSMAGNAEEGDFVPGTRIGSESSNFNANRTSRRWIERQRGRREDSHRHLGGLSLAFEKPGKATPRIIHKFHAPENKTTPAPTRGTHVAASAPVSIPNWPKILRVDSTESLLEAGYDDSVEEDDSERIPPHEYLAREYAQSQKAAATSVFEGVGRTLKGRDMSRVRDAVWSQTGFFG
ncbi:protein S40-6-like [Aristolochia californica]|uniref:protein S40-6-like n=1 Tax=Aristolochia californica TaxID=171875 RepID=UPI0035DB802F